MGERGAANEDATPEDIARMRAIVRDGLKAGALGVSTSRTLVHRTRDKAYVPGTFATVDEMIGLGRAAGEAGHGVFEIVSDIAGPDADLEWMAQLSRETGRTISLAALISRRSGMKMSGVLDFIDGIAGRGASGGLADEPAEFCASVQHASQLSTDHGWADSGGSGQADA